jgi:hypothetical protein
MLGKEPPIAAEGDRVDFVYNGRSMIGVVAEVINNTPFMHEYRIDSNNQRYRMFEQNISTPYGPHDD